MDATNEPLSGLGAVGVMGMLAIYAAIFVAMLVCYWKIVQRTGHPAALSLLIFVPCVNIGFMFWLAFTEWPVEKELRDARSQGSGGPYYRPPT